MRNIFRFGLPALIVLVLSTWFYGRKRNTPQGQHEKVLTTTSLANLKGFDPAQTESYYDACEVAKVYEGLLTYHYLKRPHELIPNLADSLPTVSEDGCVYTFSIQRGIKFHDNACFPDGRGREVIAEDFVYAIKRIADPQVQSPVYSMLAGKIKGLDAWRSKPRRDARAAYAEIIEGVRAIDRYTLQFTLAQPWPQFLYILAMPFCSVVAREAVEHYGAAFINHPVGTGPFTLDAFNPQLNRLVYHKNPTFRDKRYPSEASATYQHLLADAGKKLPLVDKIVTHILTEEQPRWLKFQQGKLDILDISKDNIALKIVQNNKLIPELQAKGVQLFVEPEQSVSYFAFNNSHVLFKDNEKLRQAISLAFDRHGYNKLFYKNASVVAQSILPPGLPGYQKDYTSPYADYHPQKAAQLLAEAGYPGGEGLPEIVLEVNASTNPRQRAEFFQKCMGDIHVKVKVVTRTFPELLRRVFQGKAMMYALSWSGDYPDAEAFLQLLRTADQGGSAGFYFSDPTYDAWYAQAVAMPPSPARTTLYEQLNRLAAERVPAVFSVHPVHFVLHQARVKNFLWADCLPGVEQYINIDSQDL